MSSDNRIDDGTQVVLIDDDPHLRKALSQTLDLAGLKVACLEDARTLEARLPADWHGVVVSDIRMPGIDGLQLLANLQGRDADLPVLLITGHGDVQLAVQAMRAGAYDFLEKPFPSEALLDSVRRALALRRLVLDNRSLRLALTDMRLEERVLYFLYVRDAMELAPQCTLTHPMLYHYPVVDALAQRGEDPGAGLATLVRRKLLEPAQLVDRTRHCRTCGSAHIHYIDVCPHCSSLQIRKEASLHCFSCGHVAPESDFHHDGGLSCPQCSAALRHIGVDYDRPLTQYACGSCHHVFVETTTQARCLACRTSCAPSALDVREVASLRLSAHGRTALRAGQIQESFAALDTANYVEAPHFRRMLDWALAVTTRHPEMRFGLMLIEFTNATELIEELGAARVFLLLDEFARRLHELLRTSDITTRTQEDKLWLFLPFSDPAGLSARLQRALSDQTVAAAPSALQARIRHLQMPQDLRAGDSAAALMERLLDHA